MKQRTGELVSVLWEDIIRTAVKTVIVLSIVMAAVLLFGQQQNKLMSAVGCELGVPSVNGTRDPVLLKDCWTDQGLKAPAYFDAP